MTSTDWPINQPDDPTQLSVPTDILCSYHYFSDIDMGAIASWGTRIIGDSGAFSAMTSGKPIDREEFHAWAARWRDDLFWTAALDEIGDAEASFENWQAARRDGLELVPTIHYGEGTAQLDRFAEEGATLVGLGGMVPYSSEKDRLMRWCLMMHRHARDHHPQVRFHGWGISHPYLVDNLPWWSTDSSGFSSCFRFGTLRLFHPRKGRFFGVALNGRDIAKHARLLRETYGIDWREVAESTPANRRPLGRVALRSVQLYAAWLQKRQAVSPPALLLPKLGDGPLQVAAQGMPAGSQTYSLTPTGESVAQLQRGPRPVAAVGAATETRYFDPSDRGAPISEPPSHSATGPRQSAALVINEGIDALGPEGRDGLPRVGPQAVAAMGAPSMQPTKALSPDDAEPTKAGPLNVGAMGGPRTAQCRAVTPSGKLIEVELGGST